MSESTQSTRERGRLSKRVQEPGETAEQYILALYTIAEKLWLRQRSTEARCYSRQTGRRDEGL